MTTPVRHIGSRDNPLLVQLRRLARDGAGSRRQGLAWIEGEHLCSALQARRRPALQAVVTEAAWQDGALRALAAWAPQVAVLPAALFGGLSALPSPAAIGFLIGLPEDLQPLPGLPSVVLDRVQDPGNVGSILRSAAAFGVVQVVALAGTAALWSPKVLRAGMGAHFSLRLVEGAGSSALDALALPLLAASAHAPDAVHARALPRPCAWVFGHEGQGVAPELLARCAGQLRIPQPGGEESLNVAAAAAVCLYESARQATE